MANATVSKHPKSLEIHETYAPDCWRSHRRYYSVVRGSYGYWATMHTKLAGSDEEKYCNVIFNDKIAKSFPVLCKKIDAHMAEHMTRLEQGRRD